LVNKLTRPTSICGEEYGEHFMNFDRGWKAINLEMTDKIPMTQYISHDAFILKKTGIRTEQGASATDIKIELAKALDYDWLNNICD